ncbi:MAG: hypothetical protein Q9218_001269 [Villophora microphyllina]
MANTDATTRLQRSERAAIAGRGCMTTVPSGEARAMKHGIDEPLVVNMAREVMQVGE